MVETTQAVLNGRGTAALPGLVAAADGRCVGAHFGTYDYTAACRITAAHQTMTHAACDFAKQVMQVVLAGTGVILSDGATNVMPVGPHRTEPGGPPLTPGAAAQEPRARSTAPGSSTSTTCAARSATATTRAGTCTRRSS